MDTTEGKKGKIKQQIQGINPLVYSDANTDSGAHLSTFAQASVQLDLGDRSTLRLRRNSTNVNTTLVIQKLKCSFKTHVLLHIFQPGIQYAVLSCFNKEHH